MAKGIPTSSVQAYLLPIAFFPKSKYILGIDFLSYYIIYLLFSIKFDLVINGKITIFKGAIQGLKYKKVLYLFLIIKECSNNIENILSIPKLGSNTNGIKFSTDIFSLYFEISIKYSLKIFILTSSIDISI